MDAILHTAIVFVTIFLSYWYGLYRGYLRGIDEGLKEGSAISAKQCLEWMRRTKDIHITDLEIREVDEELKNERS